MRTILAATDGSDAALRALDFAARMAAAMTGTRLHVLYVRLPVLVLRRDRSLRRQGTDDRALQEEAAVILEGARRFVADRISSVEFEQQEGDPGETIVRRASELGCESIVMGTHGRGRLASAILGSVAYRVVHLSTIPAGSPIASWAGHAIRKWRATRPA